MTQLTDKRTSLQLLLMDYTLELDGDIVLGLKEEARELTLEQVKNKVAHLLSEAQSQQMDAELIAWYSSQLDLLSESSHALFQEVLGDILLLSEVLVGHAIFEELSESQLEQLGNILVEQQKTSAPAPKEAENPKQKSWFKGLFKPSKA